MLQRVLLAIFIFGFFLAPAKAQERLALLIGNKAYTKEVGPLVNPHNDIAVVGAALKQIGFDKQTPLKDQKRSQILAAVRAYAGRLASAGRGGDRLPLLFGPWRGGETAPTSTTSFPSMPPTPRTTLSGTSRQARGDRAHPAGTGAARRAFRRIRCLPQRVAVAGKDGEQRPRADPDAGWHDRRIRQRVRRNGLRCRARQRTLRESIGRRVGQPGQSHLDLFQNVREAVVAATGKKQRPYEMNGLSQTRAARPDAAEPPKEIAAVPAPETHRRQPPPSATLFAEAQAAWPRRGTRRTSRRWRPSSAATARRSSEIEARRCWRRSSRRRRRERSAWRGCWRSRSADEAQSRRSRSGGGSEESCRRRQARLPLLARVRLGSGMSQRSRPARQRPAIVPMCPEMVVVPAGEFMMGSTPPRSRRSRSRSRSTHGTMPKARSTGRRSPSRSRSASSR